MKIINSLSIIISLCSLAFQSCHLNGTKESEIQPSEFLVKIIQIQEGTVPPGDKFSNYFQTASSFAKEESNYIVPSDKVDSLAESYRVYLSALDNATTELSGMSEFDQSFSILSPTVKHLEIIRKSYSETIPAFIEIYRNGLSEANDSLKMIFIKGSGIIIEGMKNAANERQIQQNEVKKFMTKYKLSY